MGDFKGKCRRGKSGDVEDQQKKVRLVRAFERLGHTQSFHGGRGGVESGRINNPQTVWADD